MQVGGQPEPVGSTHDIVWSSLFVVIENNTGPPGVLVGVSVGVGVTVGVFVGVGVIVGLFVAVGVRVAVGVSVGVGVLVAPPPVGVYVATCKQGTAGLTHGKVVAHAPRENVPSTQSTMRARLSIVYTPHRCGRTPAELVERLSGTTRKRCPALNDTDLRRRTACLHSTLPRPR